MKQKSRWLDSISLFVVIALLTVSHSGASQENNKFRIAVVGSYHDTYIWSIGTQDGFGRGLLDFMFLDHPDQITQLNKHHEIESSTSIVKRYWMDSKRKDSQADIAETLDSISLALEEFEPDILFLAEDNAANYFGNQYLDTDIPVVFWGINGSPLKYGLLDTAENPGHNITGVYQRSYHKESIEHLIKLAPNIQRIALISDDSPTGRAHTKSFIAAIREGTINIKATEVVRTNSYSTWKRKILTLSQQVDAFLISTHATMKDDDGTPISSGEAAKWYLRNVNLPETSTSIVFVKEGILAAINDSPFKQAYEAVRLGHDILINKKAPANIAAIAPDHGGFAVNSWRAAQLGLTDKLAENRHLINQLVDYNPLAPASQPSH